jgi:predicted RNA polymerase sigma factor
LRDVTFIRHGLSALHRAAKLGNAPGSYQLPAAIAACHTRARTADETDWSRIAEIYAELSALVPSPVVGRAVAVGMADLAIADRLMSGAALKNYHLLPSVRADLLAKLGRHDEARDEFERAARMAQNARERELLLERAGRGKKEGGGGTG